MFYVIFKWKQAFYTCVYVCVFRVWAQLEFNTCMNLLKHLCTTRTCQGAINIFKTYAWLISPCMLVGMSFSLWYLLVPCMCMVDTTFYMVLISLCICMTNTCSTKLHDQLTWYMVMHLVKAWSNRVLSTLLGKLDPFVVFL